MLDAYLKRIGVVDAGPPDVPLLRQLHAAHLAAIPFENLDILLGRGISLDLEHVFDKLVARRRGGYCFEQNTLFMTMLRELGFAVTPMEARVRSGSTVLRARTHMVLAVEAGERQWLADVPIRIDGDHHRLRRGIGQRVVLHPWLGIRRHDGLSGRRRLDGYGGSADISQRPAQRARSRARAHARPRAQRPQTYAHVRTLREPAVSIRGAGLLSADRRRPATAARALSSPIGRHAASTITGTGRQML